MEGIQASIARKCLLHCRFDFQVVRHVANNAQVFRANFRGDFLNTVRVARHDDHLGALGDISFGTSVADAARSAGEKDDLVLEKQMAHIIETSGRGSQTPSTKER